MSQIERLYWLDSEIRAGRYPNASMLCEQFEVSRRTAFTDRDYLVTRLGAPLVYNRAKGGWTYSSNAYSLPFLALSSREAIALSRSFMAAREYLGLPDSEVLGRIAERLGAFVPEMRIGDGASVASTTQLVKSALTSEELLSACAEAIAKRKRIHLLYYSANRGETNERTVWPYHLHNHQGEWHLLAWCEWRRGFRQFFLGRVRQWMVLQPEGSFERDESFDPAEYLGRGFGLRHGESLVAVRIKVSPYQARWIRERRYHSSQETKELPDGGLELRMRVAGTAEIKRWLLGYGGEVEVLEPEALRMELAAEAKKLQDIYSRA